MAFIDPISNFFGNHKEWVLFHRTLIIAGLAGLVAGSVVAELYSFYDDNKIANSILVLIAEYAVDIPTFVIMLLYDNRSKYADPLTGKKKKFLVLYDLQKLSVAIIASESAYVIAKVVFHYLLLSVTEPFVASIESSLIGWASFFLAINIINKKFKISASKN